MKILVKTINMVGRYRPFAIKKLKPVLKSLFVIKVIQLVCKS